MGGRRLGRTASRRGVIAEKGLVDWGMAEALAFASLLTSGVPIR